MLPRILGDSTIIQMRGKGKQKVYYMDIANLCATPSFVVMCNLAPHRLPLPLLPLPIPHVPRPSSPSIIHCCHFISTKQYQFQAAYKLLTHITLEWRRRFIPNGALVHPWKVHKNKSATNITDTDRQTLLREGLFRLVWTVQREDCKKYLHSLRIL